jgi:TorA maturation chaperone TorD
LAELGVKLLEEQDEEKYKLLNDAKCQFLSEHLLTWGPTWCALVKQHAKTDFFQGLSHLTLGAMLAIADQYDVQVPEEVSR